MFYNNAFIAKNSYFFMMKRRGLVFLAVSLILVFLILPYISGNFISTRDADNLRVGNYITTEQLENYSFKNTSWKISPGGEILDKTLKVDTAVEEKAKNFPEEEQTVIISFAPGAKPKDIKKIVKDLGGDVIYDYSIIEGAAIKIKGKDLGKIKNMSGIARVEENQVMHTFLLDSEQIIETPYVWNNLGYNGSGQTICVIDSGVNYTHPNLKDAYLGGYDFVNSDSDPLDDFGHGTHVAGIIVSNDTIYKGVAPGAKIIALKACNASGSCSQTNIIAAINWCIGNRSAFGISVITMSFGGTLKRTGFCDSWADSKAANNATAQGIFVDVASGNYAWTDGISQPACASNVTAVGATMKNDTMASYSNRASVFTNLVLAPGGHTEGCPSWNSSCNPQIVSTLIDGGFGGKIGTSMAAPHVAGLAALMRQANNTLTPLQIRQIMKDTGVSVFAEGNIYKRINATAAVKAVMPIQEFIDISFAGGNIDFGSLNPGVVDSNATNNSGYYIQVNPATNVNVNISQNGTDYSSGGNSIAINNMKWNSVNSLTGAVVLSTSDALLYSNVTPNTNKAIYYWVSVPSGASSGSYSSTISIKAVKA